MFDSRTPSCASASVSIPTSTIASPIDDVLGPFEPCLSKTFNTNQSTSLLENISKKSFSGIQHEHLNEDHQPKVADYLDKSTELITGKTELSVPIQSGEQATASEKILNINFINKNQKDIDSQDNSSGSLPDSPQYQLIGNVKDLSDVNVKETVKLRKMFANSPQGSREISINFENPTEFAFPIVRRGPFYQDSFFNEVHQNFQSAVRQVLDRWVDVPSLLSRNIETLPLQNFDRFHNTLRNYNSILDRDIFDDFTCYKSLRSRSVNEENLAATVRENDQNFTVSPQFIKITRQNVEIPTNIMQISV